MCLYPTIRINKKYTATKKNKGIIPEMKDQRVKYVPTGCGNCIECRKQKSRQWLVRLQEEIKTNTNGKFITLTFSDKSIAELKKDIDPILEGYEIDNEIATLAVRRFLERWRKEHGTSLRHWFVTELGHKGTENIHLHGIIWHTITDTEKLMDIVEKTWKYGFIWKGKRINGKLQNYVNESTISYITKYITKLDLKNKTYKSKTLCSNKPGIGMNYTTSNPDMKKNKYNGTETNETYRTRTGYKLSLPIYYRNKIYTEEEREKLWLQKLDKEERWVRGERVSIKNSYDEYDRLLEHHRAVNKQLGYGTNEKNWSRHEYERQRRNIIIQTRINKASGGVNQKG